MSSQSSSRLAIVIFVVVIILIGFGGTMLYLSRPEPAVITIIPPKPTATVAPTATRGPILVYLTGEMLNPEETYELPYGSRVEDAVRAAGGLTEHANTTLVNMAAILRDGDQVHVPSILSNETEFELPTPPGGQKIYINTATEEELQALPGVGPALAGQIVRYRDEFGAFEKLADLDMVSGIGEATLNKWQNLIAFD